MSFNNHEQHFTRTARRNILLTISNVDMYRCEFKFF